MNTRNAATYVVVLLAALAFYPQWAVAETKIGFVDMSKLSESAPQIKAAQSKIEAEFAPREKELVGLQREIRNLEERLSRDGSVMSDSESSKLERDILSNRRDLKRAQEEFRDDLNIRQSEVLAKLNRSMYEAIVALAKEQGFDLILSQGVIYSSDKVDITGSILKKLSSDPRFGN